MTEVGLRNDKEVLAEINGDKKPRKLAKTAGKVALAGAVTAAGQRATV